MKFGAVEIVAAERKLWIGGKPAAVGSRAFDLLVALATRHDRIVGKDELIEEVWPGLVVEENNLQVQVSALRKLLGSDAIATVPGRGYRFTLPPGGVPAAAVPPPAAGAATPAMPARSHGAARPSRLLVADDNKVNRLLLGRTLELLGHEVTSVENGRDALARLRGERFDLLLLDLEMPELDGYAVLEQRRADASLRELPVIVTSSVEGIAAVARCIELGADDYLHKPVNATLLKARVESSLERKHLRDRQRELLARLGHLDEAAAGSARTLDGAVLAAVLHGLDASFTGTTADELLEPLNAWTTLMVDAIESLQGQVVQIGGDRLLAWFGGSDAAAAAEAAATEMQSLAALFDAEQAAAGRPRGAMAVAIASGELVVGIAGTSRRAAQVCLGVPVQRALALVRSPDAAGKVIRDGAPR